MRLDFVTCNRDAFLNSYKNETRSKIKIWFSGIIRKIASGENNNIKNIRCFLSHNFVL